MFRFLLLLSLFCSLLQPTSASWAGEQAYCKFQERNLYRAVKKDGIPILDMPPIIACSNSTLPRHTRIYGLRVGNSALAIPKAVLRWHAVVNIKRQRAPISVTYCPLSGSAVAFAGVQLGVSGLVLDSNLVLYDKKTQSLIPQLYGEGIDGKLSGVELPTLPLVETDWGHWKKKYPHSEVVSPKHTSTIDYSRNPYATYAASDELWFPTHTRNQFLPAKTLVFTMVHKEDSVAIQLETLKKSPTQRLRIVVGGLPVRLIYDASLDAIVTDCSVKQTTAYWFAWQAAHPHTRLIR